MSKTLKERIASGTPVLMVNPNHVSPTLCEKLVRSGADAVFIDCEHGLASFEDIHHMAKAARYAGGFGIVRPQNQERSTITRCLNAGADGLMVPLIHTAEIARQVVQHFRYAVPDEHANKLLIGMVESVEAVANLDAILAVEGIDVFFVGPGDLSQSMGYSPSVPASGKRAQEVLDLVDKTLQRIRAAGKAAGTLVVKQDAAHLVAQGAQLLYYHADPFVVDGVSTMRQLTVLR
ncbi:HpcH/HpaI aldolase family protein [Aquabacterium sp.]|uniref:HpcH/HpaI aldolase family protein n=1 Tax=Aquabacterium sp. TaxID=1872578 RepID=UPI002BF93815|nr:aldolase/citrate lyase family protein [Aquabacterium sp.]HSW04000.1 aldolase/citrate lyase family protein [Aquabacterium sp.]